MNTFDEERAALVAKVADQAATIESLQKQDAFHAQAMSSWQEWARGLLDSGGLQLPDGQWGDDNARKILAGELERSNTFVGKVREALAIGEDKSLGYFLMGEAIKDFDAQTKGGGT